jgi:hypothetical protein
MSVFAAIIVLAVSAAGCSQNIPGTPVEEPQTIHCDMIFPPAPPSRT